MNSKKILVVDDNETVLTALAMKLRSQGYDVITAEDGSEATAAVRKEKPDLIVCDINFPMDVPPGLVDGFTVLAWLERLQGPAKTPIVLITGGDPAKNEKEAKAMGAAGFFHKSADPQILFALIRKILGEAPAAS
jgi:CheY-like chemotaxis protein